MTFWEVFWAANSLIWPVYAALAVFYIIGIAVIWWSERKENQD